MREVVFTTPSGEPKFESDFRDERFAATKPDAHSGTLTVKNLELQDKGLYFCAVSEHSDGSDSDSCTNAQLLLSQ